MEILESKTITRVKTTHLLVRQVVRNLVLSYVHGKDVILTQSVQYLHSHPDDQVVIENEGVKVVLSLTGREAYVEYKIFFETKKYFLNVERTYDNTLVIEYPYYVEIKTTN